MNQGARKHSLSIGCLNARSICNKVPNVTELLLDNSIDVCFLTESWLKLNDKAKFAEIREHGFNIHSAPRRGRGGGVAFLFNPLNVTLTRNNANKYKSFEVLESVFKSQIGLIRLSVVYRTTQTSSKAKYAETRQVLFFQEFAEYLDLIGTKSGKPIICGDFNFHVEDSSDHAANKFKEVYMSKGFTQHNTLPTHGDSTLDLVLTSDAICDNISVSDIHVIDESPSDHSLLCFDIPATPVEIISKGTTTSIKQIRLMSKINIDAFKKDITENMPSAEKLASLDDAVESYNSILKDILDKHAPLKTVSFREGKNPWWSAKCQEARTARRTAERKYKKDKLKNSPNWQDSYSHFKEAQVDAAIILNRERDRFYTSELSSAAGSTKASYKIVNKLLDKQYGTNILPNGDSDISIANNLKDFFHSKVVKIYNEIDENSKHITVPTTVSKSEVKVSYFKLMTVDSVAQIINDMNTKSCESDPIPTWLFKNCSTELLPIVTLIINLSLQSGIFPKSMKSAIVRATLKKPNLDSDVLSNYRPISNLSFLSKVLEKCVHIQLTEYITNSQLFAKYQSGYRKGHSTDTAVLKIQNDTLLLIDKKSHVILMLLDLSAAFDTVNHEILVKKLQNLYGFGGHIVEWIKSYLAGRSFKVCVNGHSSDSCCLEIGVPQGSILGPLLFILYTKELEDIAKRYGFCIHLYADDSQIYFSFDPTSEDDDSLQKLQMCFNEIKQWMSLNFLKMNDDKTEILELYGFQPLSPPHETFILGNSCECEVTPTLSAKNLGFHFDSKMNLDTQIIKVTQKCYINLRNIGRLGSKLSFALKIQLVHSMVLSILDLGNASYGSITAGQLNKLQKVQNSSARFIFGLYGKASRQHIGPYLKKLHFLPVYYRIRFKIALLVFKSLNNLAPEYISSMINPRTDAFHGVRRNGDSFLLCVPPAPRYSKTNGAFSISAPTVWNTLPYRMRSSSDVNEFKTLLKTHYFELAFGDHEEIYNDIDLIT